MQTAEEYLIEPHINHDAYQRRFALLMRKLDMPQHRTHDCRHTFASLMDTAGVNDRALKTIIGHVGGDLTSKVYIHKSLPELLCAVNCI
jgi:integrase